MQQPPALLTQLLASNLVPSPLNQQTVNYLLLPPQLVLGHLPALVEFVAFYIGGIEISDLYFLLDIQLSKNDISHKSKDEDHH
jgi:hypothetical protein